MNCDTDNIKIDHRARKRIREVKRKARPGKFLTYMF